MCHLHGPLTGRSREFGIGMKGTRAPVSAKALGPLGQMPPRSPFGSSGGVKSTRGQMLYKLEGPLSRLKLLVPAPAWPQSPEGPPFRVAWITLRLEHRDQGQGETGGPEGQGKAPEAQEPRAPELRPSRRGAAQPRPRGPVRPLPRPESASASESVFLKVFAGRNPCPRTACRVFLQAGSRPAVSRTTPTESPPLGMGPRNLRFHQLSDGS